MFNVQISWKKQMYLKQSSFLSKVLDSDVTEEVSLAHCTVPDDVLASDITSASMSMPEHVLTSESIHVSDIGHVQTLFMIA